MRQLFVLMVMLFTSLMRADAQGIIGNTTRADKMELRRIVQQLITSHHDAKQVLKELDLNCGTALVEGDVETLKMIEADNFTFTGPDGNIATKSQDLETITSGDLVYEALSFDDVLVRVFGDTGVITGRANVRARYKTVDISGAYRYTVTFVRLSGRWQVVASQMTRVQA
jgi:hypothetical protein